MAVGWKTWTFWTLRGVRHSEKPVAGHGGSGGLFWWFSLWLNPLYGNYTYVVFSPASASPSQRLKSLAREAKSPARAGPWRMNVARMVEGLSTMNFPYRAPGLPPFQRWLGWVPGGRIPPSPEDMGQEPYRLYRISIMGSTYHRRSHANNPGRRSHVDLVPGRRHSASGRLLFAAGCAAVRVLSEPDVFADCLWDRKNGYDCKFQCFKGIRALLQEQFFF